MPGRATLSIDGEQTVPLKVIGAGFGRTGTYSLKLALEQLGFGPCYHGIEVLRNPSTAQLWIDAADGKPDWAKIFAGRNSTVDWPSCTFYAELADFYPGARVILTERDPEAWFTSTQNTIFPDNEPPDTGKPFDTMTRKIIAPLFNFRTRETRQCRGEFQAPQRRGPPAHRPRAIAGLRSRTGLGAIVPLPRRAGSGNADAQDQHDRRLPQVRTAQLIDTGAETTCGCIF